MKKIRIFLIIWIASMSEPYARSTESADSIVVWKSERKLMYYHNGVKTFKVSLGRKPKGPKERQGDKKTPEGRYKIVRQNPHSGFYKSLALDYPNATDKALGRTGGDIMIHGLKNNSPKIGKLHLLIDWTQGCIAVTNKEMEYLYTHVALGTPVIIHP